MTNAYDALATDVRLLVPANVAAEDAMIWVIDNGESMDVEGLHELCQIASSNKRVDEDARPRQPIGRFGIGKLATYVLAQQLTHVCKKNSRYLAITMNYAAIPHGSDASTHPVNLDVRELTEDEAKTALQPMKALEGGVDAFDWLFDGKTPESWTVAVMSQLKPLARDLKLGRLRWILSTALPMSPKFRLHLNGAAVASAVERREVLSKPTSTRIEIRGRSRRARTAAAPSANTGNAALRNASIRTVAARVTAAPSPIRRGGSGSRLAADVSGTVDEREEDDRHRDDDQPGKRHRSCERRSGETLVREDDQVGQVRTWEEK